MGASDRADTTVGGRYRLGRRLGSGGVGHVHLAHDTALDRRVAVKVLRPELADDPDARERFRTETVRAASVTHPNIVPVLDAIADGPVLALVMEVVDGPTLASVLDEGALAPDVVHELVGGIADGLDAAHATGLVHRDLKPANVLLDRGMPRLVDFGLSRPMSGRVVDGTLVRGSPGYVAPEQARGEPTTPRTDVYALACIAYHALAGRPPYHGASTTAVLADHVAPEVVDPRAHVPDIADAAADVLRAGLATDPADRPASASAFAAALHRSSGTRRPRRPDVLRRSRPAPSLSTITPVEDRVTGRLRPPAGGHGDGDGPT